MLFKGTFRHEKEKELGNPFHLEIATVDDVKELLAWHGLVAVKISDLEHVAIGYKAFTEVPRYKRIAQSLLNTIQEYREKLDEV